MSLWITSDITGVTGFENSRLHKCKHFTTEGVPGCKKVKNLSSHLFKLNQCMSDAADFKTF